MAKSLFYKLIRCSHCGSFFKKKVEKGNVKYICTYYDSSPRKCEHRIVIEESFIRGLIERRFDKELTDQEIRNNVGLITVREKLRFKIDLIGQESIEFGDNFIRY